MRNTSLPRWPTFPPSSSCWRRSVRTGPGGSRTIGTDGQRHRAWQPGITYAEKAALKWDGGWENEIRRRLQRPEYRDRRAVITLERYPGHLVFRIVDQGAGFAWANYLDFDPERAFDANGRGIAMARATSFSHLEYAGRGNTVSAWVDLP